MILRAYGNFCQNRKDQNFLDVRYGQREFPKVAGIFTLVESSNQLFDFFGLIEQNEPYLLYNQNRLRNASENFSSDIYY